MTAIAIAHVQAGQVTALTGVLAAEEGEHGEVEFHAEHAWLPPRDELIWGTLSFALIALLLLAKGLPAAKKMAADRTERIAKELSSAEAARADAERAAATVLAQLQDADAESARILDEARTAADALKADQRMRLATELAELRARAVDDIETSKVRAVQELQGRAGVLAIGAAEQVVRRSLDPDTQQALVESFISSLDSSGVRS